MLNRLILLACLWAGVAVLAQDAAPTQWQWRGADLAYPDGKNAAWLPPKLIRLYKVVDDENAEDGKALRVYVDARALQQESIPILRAPMLNVPVGTYKVTVRVKMTGMLNVIGNAVHFDSKKAAPADDYKHRRYDDPTLHGYLFQDEDVYQEFSYLTEVIEPDYLSGRPERPSPKSPFGYLVSKTEVEAWKAGEGTPWERKAKEAAAKQVIPTEPEELDKLRHGRLTVYMDFLNTEKLGFGRIQPTMRHLTVDWLKVEKMPEPAHLVVRKMVPTKLWMRPGDTTAFDVWVHNRSGETRSGTLRVTVRHGVNGSISVGEQQITLDDHGYATVSFPWTAPKGDLWGCTAEAELVEGDQVVSSAFDVFSVLQNQWAIHNHGGANRWRDPYSKLPNYRTYVEMFGATPGDALKPFPDDPGVPYFTGMSGYATLMDVQKMCVQYNHKLGVGCYLYIQPACGTSIYPELLYAKHPEWWGGPIGWNDQIHDNWTRELTALAKGWADGTVEHSSVPEGMLHIEAPINYAVPYMFENLLDGALKNLQYVGWDGIRWDGDFPVHTTTNHHISFGPGSPAADREKSANYTKRFKAEARKLMPNYTEGANIGTPEQVWNKKFENATEKPPTDYHNAFLADGSSVMSEDWMNAWVFTDARNVIRDYYWGARRCAEWCRERGGFWHSFPPMRDATPYFTQSMIYYNLLIPLAGGTYPGQFSCTPGSETGTAQFVTRFSEFLFDLKLQPLENAQDTIRVDTDHELWYAEGTRWRDLPDGRRRYVIPLINPPTIERFLLRDRFSELPEPIREPFPVEVDTPEGFESAKVYMLTAEPRTAVKELEADADDKLVYVEVPDLVIYRVLVVEFSKEAGK